MQTKQVKKINIYLKTEFKKLLIGLLPMIFLTSTQKMSNRGPFDRPLFVGTRERRFVLSFFKLRG
jgi:hypothetical protein